MLYPQNGTVLNNFKKFALLKVGIIIETSGSALSNGDENESISYLNGLFDIEILEKAKAKNVQIHLPVDVVAADAFSNEANTAKQSASVTVHCSEIIRDNFSIPTSPSPMAEA